MDFREADRLISAEWAANNEALRDAQTKRSRLMVEVEAADGDILRLVERRDQLAAALVRLRETVDETPTAETV